MTVLHLLLQHGICGIESDNKIREQPRETRTLIVEQFVAFGLTAGHDESTISQWEGLTSVIARSMGVSRMGLIGGGDVRIG